MCQKRVAAGVLAFVVAPMTAAFGQIGEPTAPGDPAAKIAEGSAAYFASLAVVGPDDPYLTPGAQDSVRMLPELREALAETAKQLRKALSDDTLKLRIDKAYAAAASDTAAGATVHAEGRAADVALDPAPATWPPEVLSTVAAAGLFQSVSLIGEEAAPDGFHVAINQPLSPLLLGGLAKAELEDVSPEVRVAWRGVTDYAESKSVDEIRRTYPGTSAAAAAVAARYHFLSKETTERLDALNDAGDAAASNAARDQLAVHVPALFDFVEDVPDSTATLAAVADLIRCLAALQDREGFIVFMDRFPALPDALVAKAYAQQLHCAEVLALDDETGGGDPAAFAELDLKALDGFLRVEYDAPQWGTVANIAVLTAIDQEGRLKKKLATIQAQEDQAGALLGRALQMLVTLDDLAFEDVGPAGAEDAPTAVAYRDPEQAQFLVHKVKRIEAVLAACYPNSEAFRTYYGLSLQLKANRHLGQISKGIDQLRHQLAEEHTETQAALKDGFAGVKAVLNERFAELRADNRIISEQLAQLGRGVAVLHDDLQGVNQRLDVANRQLGTAVEHLRAIYDQEVQANEQLQGVTNVLKDIRHEVKQNTSHLADISRTQQEVVASIQRVEGQLLETNEQLAGISDDLEEINDRLDDQDHMTGLGMITGMAWGNSAVGNKAQKYLDDRGRALSSGYNKVKSSVFGFFMDRELVPYDYRLSANLSLNLKTLQVYGECDIPAVATVNLKQLLQQGDLGAVDPDLKSSIGATFGVRAAVEDHYDALRAEAEEEHAALCYISSRRFVDRLSVEALGADVVKGVVTAGASVKSSAADLADVLEQELNEVVLFFESALGSADAEAVLAAIETIAEQRDASDDITAGQSLIEVRWRPVLYSYSFEQRGLSFLKSKHLRALGIEIPDAAIPSGRTVRSHHGGFIIIVRQPQRSLDDVLGQLTSMGAGDRGAAALEANRAVLASVSSSAGRNVAAVISAVSGATAEWSPENVAGIGDKLATSIGLAGDMSLLKQTLADLKAAGRLTSSRVDLKGTPVADGIETFFKKHFAFGNEKDARVEELYLDLATYRVEARVAIRSRHSWGTVGEALSELPGLDSLLADIF